MSPPIIVITGANRGIGLAFAKHYAATCPSGTVFLGNRGSSSDIPEQCTVLSLDLSSQSSISDFVKKLSGRPISLLINNAGILIKDTIQDFTIEGIQKHILVNASAPMFLSQQLLINLKMVPNSKVVFITSRFGSIGDNSSSGYYSYRVSKSALNSLAKCFSIDLKGIVNVGLIHPGHVKTDMGGPTGEIEADECVSRMVKIIDKLDQGNSGTFYHRDGMVLPW